MKTSLLKIFRAISRRFRDEESGATTVEYALLIALILVFSISAVLSAGDVQKALWFDTADRVQTIVP